MHSAAAGPLAPGGQGGQSDQSDPGNRVELLDLPGDVLTTILQSEHEGSWDVRRSCATLRHLWPASRVSLRVKATAFIPSAETKLFWQGFIRLEHLEIHELHDSTIDFSVLSSDATPVLRTLHVTGEASGSTAGVATLKTLPIDAIVFQHLLFDERVEHDADYTAVVLACPGLRTLSVHSGFWVSDRTVAALAGCPRLTKLCINRNVELTTVDPLAGRTALTALDLSCCWNVTSIRPLAGLVALTELSLSYCGSVKVFEPLRSLTALTKLSLRLCDVVSADPLRGLTTLTELDLDNCYNLLSVEPLKGLTELVKLGLCCCERLVSIDPLRGLTALTELRLCGCFRLKSTEALRSLTRLTASTARVSW
jgi:hypothetical protein